MPSQENNLAAGLTCLFALVFAYPATNVFRGYALGLFIWVLYLLKFDVVDQPEPMR